MTSTQHSRVRLLVAESTPYASELLAVMLRATEFKAITVVSSAGDLIGALRTGAFDLILMGDQVAGTDGIEIARSVRRLDVEQGQGVPIVMLFSDSSQRNIVAARDAGVTDFIKKPVSAAVLASRIELVLGRPRALVLDDSYVGPDRRRRDVPHSGNERRNR